MRLYVPAAVGMVALAGCQLIGGIDSRSVGTVDDAATDATIGGDSGGGDASVDASDAAEVIAPAFDAGTCPVGATRCNGLQPQSCQGSQWANAAPPCEYVCDAGGCTGICTPTSLRCVGLQPQTCTNAGQWADTGVPCPTLCNEGSCAACLAGVEGCNGPQPQTCNDAGLWEPSASPCQYVCTTGSCTGTCTPGAVRCSGNQPQICNSGNWANNGATCPYGCSAGGCVVTYPGEVMADSPLAYWRLDEPAGSTTAFDYTGNGNNGTYYGDVTLGQTGAIVSDPSDTAAYLNKSGGQSGYVGVSGTFATTSEFAGQSSFTIEAWIQPSVVDAEYRGVVSNEATAGTGKDGYVLYVGGFTGTSGVGVGFDRWAGTSSTPVQDAGAVSAGTTWYHVVGVYNGMTQILYVNGQLVASASAALNIPAFGCTFNIGATHCGTTGFFQGVVDEVAVYGTQLPLARIQAHFEAAQ